MSDLVVSYYVYGPNADPVGQRIWDDGRVESYLTTKFEKNTAGGYERKPQVPGWYPTTEISSEQLDVVYRSLEDAGVKDMPEQIDTVQPSRTDSSTAVWQVRVQSESGGHLKEIKVAQWGPLAPDAVPLMTLLVKLHTIINSTLVAKG